MADQTSVQLQKRPEGVSCTPCRRVKMKCLSSNPASAICDRCEKSGKQCIYETHRRGMWRRNYDGKREDPQYSTNNNPAAPSTGGNDGFLSDLGRSSFKNRTSGSHSAISGSMESPFTPGTSSATLDTETTSSAESFNRLNLLAQDPDSTTNPTKIHDPIEIGLISRQSAQILFELFFEHFNSLLGLLDPQLYSFIYTRSRSSLLFTMILATASRIFHPQSYKAIKDHSEALLGSVLLACDSTVENIWAIICMYHWKDEYDKRGEVLIGFASRMAAYAEWNMPHQNISGRGHTLESGEIKLRQEHDRQRVLTILYSNDRKLTYLTKYPPQTSLVVPKSTSRTLINSTEFSYDLGDCKSVSNLELTNIALDVYESIAKFEKHHDSQPKLAVDFENLQNDMNTFNKKINQWREEWCSIYSNFPNLEPLQRPVTLLQRDYICLYFNTAYLNILLASENWPSPNDQITHTTCICLSSALGILQSAVRFGGLGVICYLWDNSHRMIAYAAMLIPKLLAQGIKDTTTLKQEAALILDQAATTYFIACRSIGIRESNTPAHTTENENRISTQARLLSAIRAAINSSMSYVEQSSEAGGVLDMPFNPDLPWLEEEQTPFSFFAEDRTNNLQSLNMSFDDYTLTQPSYLVSCVPQAYKMLDFLEDKEFLDSMYLDAGILPLQEPGILVRSS